MRFEPSIYHIRLWPMAILALQVLSHEYFGKLVYIMLNIILFKSAACSDLACFHQSPCAIYILFPVFY